MAHIGKQGPVAFRRDFNLNVSNNNSGWARRYYASLTTLSQGIGATISGVVFECGPDTYPADGQIDWISPYQFLGNGFYRWELLLTIANGVRFNKQFAIEVKNFGIILVVHEDTADPHINQPGWGNFMSPVVDFYNTDFWDEPPVVAPFIIPKTWADPPPH